MTKPWEQEWNQEALDARIVTRSSDGLVVADPRGDSFSEAVELAKFISAAPDMARALMELVRLAPESSEDRAVVLAREALKAAGVIS